MHKLFVIHDFVFRLKFNGDLVVARPDIIQVVLGSDAELVLLASDGLWDYINRYFPLTIFLFANNEKFS